MIIRAFCITVFLTVLPLAGAQVQPTSRPAGNLLGEKFESLAAGISLHAPAGSRPIRGAVGSNEIVRFINETDKTTLRLSRVILEPDKPLPLTKWKDKAGVERQGMLELTTEQFKTETPAAEILRQDVINIGEATVGMMAARYSVALDTNLIQQAIVRAGDLQYYVLAMTCAAPRKGDVSADPTVRRAVETFAQVLDSVQLLDQTRIKEDQDERLFRTRALLVNLTEAKLRAALQPQQWLRVIHEGKDVGYTYVVEEVARDLPRRGGRKIQTGPEGVLIGARSRRVLSGGTQNDAESWCFCTFDRKYEGWSAIAYSADSSGTKLASGELGVSRHREKPVPDAGLDVGSRRGVSLTEEYRLEVTKLGPNLSNDPIARDLPPFYLPQVYGQLLARLVPLREAKSYLFATWVSDANEVMYRYIDVEREQETALGGKRYRAVPVHDRIGLEGSVTTHYISPEGKWLGSVNDAASITILPTNEAALQKLWQNANLSRPGDLEQK